MSEPQNAEYWRLKYDYLLSVGDDIRLGRFIMSADEKLTEKQKKDIILEE